MKYGGVLELALPFISSSDNHAVACTSRGMMRTTWETLTLVLLRNRDPDSDRVRDADLMRAWARWYAWYERAIGIGISMKKHSSTVQLGSTFLWWGAWQWKRGERRSSRCLEPMEVRGVYSSSSSGTRVVQFANYDKKVKLRDCDVLIPSDALTRVVWVKDYNHTASVHICGQIISNLVHLKLLNVTPPPPARALTVQESRETDGPGLVDLDSMAGGDLPIPIARHAVVWRLLLPWLSQEDQCAAGSTSKAHVQLIADWWRHNRLRGLLEQVEKNTRVCGRSYPQSCQRTPVQTWLRWDALLHPQLPMRRCPTVSLGVGEMYDVLDQHNIWHPACVMELGMIHATVRFDGWGTSMIEKVSLRRRDRFAKFGTHSYVRGGPVRARTYCAIPKNVGGQYAVCSINDVHACPHTSRVRVCITMLSSGQVLHVWTQSRHALMPVSDRTTPFLCKYLSPKMLARPSPPRMDGL